mmetsp:Transcript_71699/g.181136  ORF Transcript_71699/g.181136 Transcript_71699/m.181136 type:complete len:80 (-) Transcript_71699:93-332(-)
MCPTSCLGVLRGACLASVEPGSSEEDIAYVNRLLTFIFAADDCFDQLMQLPNQPFVMSCGNQLCISLSHTLSRTISVAV